MRSMFSRRGGFTLVELIVVMAILATLAALAVGAYSRVRAGQAHATTESTLVKLNTIIEDRRSKIVNQVNNMQIPPQVLTYASNDQDRAVAVLHHAYLTVNFPTTQQEAITDINLGGYIVPHLRAFNTLSGTGSAEEQSAACLYVIASLVSETGGTGLDQQTAESPAGRVYVDAWGTPISFLRLGYSFDGEVDSNTWANRVQSGSKDFNDPLGRLANPSWTNQAAFWTLISSKHKQYGISESSPPQLPMMNPPGGYPGTTRNFVLTAVSSGPDKNIGSTFVIPIEPTDPVPVKEIKQKWLDLTQDNLLSFRLRREGQKAGF